MTSRSASSTIVDIHSFSSLSPCPPCLRGSYLPAFVVLISRCSPAESGSACQLGDCTLVRPWARRLVARLQFFGRRGPERSGLPAGLIASGRCRRRRRGRQWKKYTWARTGIDVPRISTAGRPVQAGPLRLQDLVADQKDARRGVGQLGWPEDVPTTRPWSCRLD